MLKNLLTVSEFELAEKHYVNPGVRFIAHQIHLCQEDIENFPQTCNFAKWKLQQLKEELIGLLELLERKEK